MPQGKGRGAKAKSVVKLNPSSKIKELRLSSRPKRGRISLNLGSPASGRSISTQPTQSTSLAPIQTQQPMHHISPKELESTKENAGNNDVDFDDRASAAGISLEAKSDNILEKTKEKEIVSLQKSDKDEPKRNVIHDERNSVDEDGMEPLNSHRKVNEDESFETQWSKIENEWKESLDESVLLLQDFEKSNEIGEKSVLKDLDGSANSTGLFKSEILEAILKMDALLEGKDMK
ncbi:uncharacterized protein MONOS_6752 [Monocercomonoides exilis]|uniref:uncharacterized protein n=1 Tax=Monocercomonoides exilis TaxID=2049356 RepID=UPI00355AA4D2|nr:hypothetical protein MONOS_6752 [Monocercomonoides exilis]|eukprot:MONOS_6752.1-p1 / transcript=MONOS_6752.1 / gene=MONOS_6752 / organism=Monocercomonoides_exilis_PA203 / gene_product=unspecified product / transcript_product=unspecified product / location=Mono_scaffold00218:73814-74512(-) / protein_length=233 / sequence_SO=supercontig / SO=protein_coding / is_pseudo=false